VQARIARLPAEVAGLSNLIRRVAHATSGNKEARGELVRHGDLAGVRAIKRLRTRLSTLGDRRRHATYGSAPPGSPHPAQEAELAELQACGAQAIGDAQDISDLAHGVAMTEPLDLEPPRWALDRVHDAPERTRAVV
jgi:hypothetical protein